jgi:hypothetical protein
MGMNNRRPGEAAGGTVAASPAGEHRKDWVAKGLFTLGVACSLFVFVRWIGQPLLDQHNFRQTQTAISAYWMAREPGPSQWFNYQTPIFGSPWQIPLELPVYQGLVAGAHLLTGLPLDAVGRGLSALCFYCLLWPLGMLVRDYGANRRGFYLTGGLLMLSPLYLYWSRTFMIESTALLVSMLYLAWLRHYLVRRKARYLVLGSVAAVLAITIKVTTFAVCVAAGGMMVMAHMIQERAWARPTRALALYLPILAGLAPSALALQLWLQHTTGVMATSYFGHILVPSNLHLWTYGTAAQRMSVELWRDVIWRRAIPQAVGSQFSLLLCLVFFVRMTMGARFLVVALLTAFMLPFVALTNLHLVHNYYQYANSVFLILAISAALLRLAEYRSAAPLALGCILVVAGDVVTFSRAYLKSANARFADEPVLQLADYLRETTSPESVLVIHGCEWNPVLAYYSQRRAIYIPSWARRNELEALVQHPERLTDRRPISAVVEFENGFEPVNWNLWEGFLDHLKTQSVVKRFSQYQVLVPRGSNVWAETIATNSLPSPPKSESVWAEHFPADWDAGRILAARACKMDDAVLDGRRLPPSSSPVEVNRGARLHLRGAVTEKDGTDEPIVLALWGQTNWAPRFLWVTTKPAPGTNTQFEVECTIPTELPDDTYEVLAFQKAGRDLVPNRPRLRLQLKTAGQEKLPADWPAATIQDLLGGADALRLNGEQVDFRSAPTVVSTPGSKLEVWGWTADVTEGTAHPDLLIQLTGTSNGVNRYVPARRYWRADASKALGSHDYDLSGFRLRCNLPEDLPLDVYQLKVLQKGLSHTVLLDLRIGINLQRKNG